MTSRPYIVEKILPSRRIHLLAGISSAGKSRFAIPNLIMWSAGVSLMGLKSYPVPWCTVCTDRPLEDMTDAVRTMGFDPADYPIIPAFGKYKRPDYEIMEEIQRLKAEFVFWEGFDMMVKNANNANEVHTFLSRMSSYCEEGLTILGSVGVAKLKPHEIYPNPRQLVAGASLWERATSTNLVIMATQPGHIGSSERILYVCLKNDPSFSVLGRFDDNGMLFFDPWEQQLTGPQLELIQAKMRRRTSSGGLT